MLVKIGMAVVNMASIDSITVKDRAIKTRKSNGWFKKATVTEHYEYDIVVKYRDADGRQGIFTLDCGSNAEAMFKEKDRICAQAKELENTGATQALEEALRNV